MFALFPFLSGASPTIPQWEFTADFDPTSVISPSVRWVSFDGPPLEVAQGMGEGNMHIASQFVDDVISGQARADVSMLTFRDHDSFVPGNLYNHFPAWERIANIAPFDLTPKILLWIKNCVDVQDFFQPFKGQYRGENFDSTLPPHRIFSNAPSCKPFAQFISDTIIDRLRTGAISLWGRVREVPPPLLVMPLTVEPSKPRLCNDNRFLNLWIRDMPFQLDSLLGLPRYVFPSSFQSVCDDKSG